MGVNAIPLPHFAGKKSLSLQDLDALAARVLAHDGAGAEYVPAGAHKGRKQYGNAWYNMGQFVDECGGETAARDKAGMIASVSCQPVVEPYISNGNMVLPLAQSAWPDEYGGVTTPGLVVGVALDAAAGACYIEGGVIHLPAGGGGGCGCGPAFYEECVGSCIGLIRSVGYEVGLMGPKIDDGRIRLPLCTTAGECPGVAGGIASVLMDEAAVAPSISNGVIRMPVAGLKGVMCEDGPRSWHELACAGVVRLHAGDASSLGVSVQVTAGYLNIFVDRV